MSNNVDDNIQDDQKIISDVMHDMLGGLSDKYNAFTKDMRDTKSMGTSVAIMSAEYYQRLIDGTLN